MLIDCPESEQADSLPYKTSLRNQLSVDHLIHGTASQLLTNIVGNSMETGEDQRRSEISHKSPLCVDRARYPYSPLPDGSVYHTL